MKPILAILPWQSEEAAAALKNRRIVGNGRKRHYAVTAPLHRDTLCHVCKKLFDRRDIKGGVCIWCIYDHEREGL